MEAMFSPLWYRVASLRPRLRAHTHIHRHRYRGRVWYVLQNHTTGRFHRFSRTSQRVIGALDGEHTVDEIWRRCLTELGDEAPSQGDVIRLLSQLHQAEALVGDQAPDFGELWRREQKRAATARFQRLRNPLAIRIPLFDPERLLSQLVPWFRPLLGGAGLALWGVTMLVSLCLVAVHWSELSENVTERVLAADNLLLIWLIFPVVKAIHEMGHALVARALGAEVHEMGVMILVLTPIPYVDVSSTSAFRDKRQRALVAAAGMMVELLLASLALAIWIHAEPGMVRTTCYNIMLISGFSTLLFNANPLIRFDGYYILGDLIEVPNLGQRANRYVVGLLKRHLLGVRASGPGFGAAAEVGDRGEARILLAYALASFVYRLFLVVSIALFVATQLFFLGVVLALMGIVQMVGLPLWRAVRFVFTDDELDPNRARAHAVLWGGVGLALAVCFLAPAPYRTLAEGVVWAPDESVLRGRAAGVVVEVLRPPGEHVEAGVALLRLESPELVAQVRVLEARLREIEARSDEEGSGDRVQAGILADQREQVRAQLAQAQERAAGLVVKSPVAGELVLPAADDLIGVFVERGQALGFVVEPQRLTVRAVVPQEDVDIVRERTRSVSVRTAPHFARQLAASVSREVPAATDELPSAALSSEGGGRLTQTPTAQGDLALAQVFHFEVRPEQPFRTSWIGARAHVRFEHGAEPLGFRGLRALRQLFLREFDV